MELIDFIENNLTNYDVVITLTFWKILRKTYKLHKGIEKEERK